MRLSFAHVHICVQMKARRVTEQDELIAAVTAHADTIYNCFLAATASNSHAKHTTAAAAATAVSSLDTLLPVRKGSVRGAATERALLYSTAVAKCIHTSLTTASTVTNSSTSSIIDSSEKLSQQIRALTRKLSVAAVGHGPTYIAASRRALLNKCFPVITSADHTLCDKATAAAIRVTADTAIDTTVTTKCDAATTTAAIDSADVSNGKVVRRSFNRECWYRLEHVLPLETVMRSELALLNSCYANATSNSSNSSSGNSTAMLHDDDLLTAVDTQIGEKGGCMPRIHTGITDQYLYRSLYALQLHRCTR
jgi:hypothetical protein